MSELRESHKRILELFSELGVRELDVDTVARRFGWKRSTAKKYMDQLARLGLLYKKSGGVYELPAGEEAKPEEKPVAKVAEAAEAAEAQPAPQQPQPAEAQQPLQPVGEAAEEMGREAMEVKPAGEVVESFYFYNRGTVVPLRVSSLEQLAAVLRYRLVTPEELAYAIRTGFLQTWIERSLHDQELARKLDELRGLNDQELYSEAAKIVSEKVRLC